MDQELILKKFHTLTYRNQETLLGHPGVSCNYINYFSTWNFEIMDKIMWRDND